MATINGVIGAQYTVDQPGYDDRKYQYATSSYGDEHKMKPALIVYPTSKADISKAIQYARSEGISIAVRTGGHQYSGASSTMAPNIQLDLKKTFRGTDDRQVFEKDGETFVRTGVSWPLGAFNKFLGENGLFVPHGQCTNVHLGGHVQTGGYGQLGRSFGLFGDHVIGLEIVDWQGSIKEVTKKSDPELFSAFLGGSPGNLGVITHIVLKVHRDKDYVGSLGLKALYWYDPKTLERLLNIVAEMSDDVNFPRNYDLCVSVLSSSNELLDWFPEVDLKMQREHPELYGEDGNPFWPRVIICYAQWVPFAKDDVPDEGWFERIKEGCLFPFTTNADVKPMSELTKQWIFTNVREFDKPYVKSTLLSDSTDLVKRGWAKWCTERVDAIVKPQANRCWLSAQFQPFGGKNSMFTRNAQNGTSYSWRNSTVCATMDIFYGASHKTTAEDWHTVTIQQAVGENGKFSNQERRVLWGSFGDYNLDKVWKLYYDDEKQYEKLKVARSKADPEGVFTPNTFAVALIQACKRNAMKSNMANYNNFGALSPEVLDAIISSLPKKDQASLSRVSHSFHAILAEYLYSSWEYHGLDHTFKSLHCFLRTVIQSPDIASLVKTLDIREWGDCPRLKDYLADSEDGSDDADSEDPSDDSDDPDMMEDFDSELEHSENTVSPPVEDDKSISSSVSKNSSTLEDGGLSDEEYNRDFSILHLAAQQIGLQHDEIFDFEMDIRERKEDVLMALLIANLPSLTTLYMVLAEEQEAIPNLVKRALNRESKFLKNLETIYLCSALHIGIKGHRQYHLDHRLILGFLDLPNLRSAYTLTATDMPWSLENYTKRLISDDHPEYNTINYALEQADINPLDTMAGLIHFKSLQSFRWSQYFTCVSKGSCAGPFYRHLKNALQPFKDTMVNLDLDLRRRSCRTGMDTGHAFNPRANVEDMVSFYKEPEEREPGQHLVGSLTDFSNLKHLSIDVSALHGDSIWGYSYRKLADSLPASLESLVLQSIVHNDDTDMLLVALSTTLSEDVTDLAQRASLKAPLLKSMALKILYTSPETELSKAWSSELKSIQDTFMKDGIKFQITCEKLASTKDLVQIPFFKEINDRRAPGLD